MAAKLTNDQIINVLKARKEAGSQSPLLFSKELSDKAMDSAIRAHIANVQGKELKIEDIRKSEDIRQLYQESLKTAEKLSDFVFKEVGQAVSQYATDNDLESLENLIIFYSSKAAEYKSLLGEKYEDAEVSEDVKNYYLFSNSSGGAVALLSEYNSLIDSFDKIVTALESFEAEKNPMLIKELHLFSADIVEGLIAGEEAEKQFSTNGKIIEPEETNFPGEEPAMVETPAAPANKKMGKLKKGLLYSALVLGIAAGSIFGYRAIENSNKTEIPSKPKIENVQSNAAPSATSGVLAQSKIDSLKLSNTAGADEKLDSVLASAIAKANDTNASKRLAPSSGTISINDSTLTDASDSISNAKANAANAKTPKAYNAKANAGKTANAKTPKTYNAKANAGKIVKANPPKAHNINESARAKAVHFWSIKNLTTPNTVIIPANLAPDGKEASVLLDSAHAGNLKAAREGGFWKVIKNLYPNLTNREIAKIYLQVAEINIGAKAPTEKSANTVAETEKKAANEDIMAPKEDNVALSPGAKSLEQIQQMVNEYKNTKSPELYESAKAIYNDVKERYSPGVDSLKSQPLPNQISPQTQPPQNKNMESAPGNFEDSLNTRPTSLYQPNPQSPVISSSAPKTSISQLSLDNSLSEKEKMKQVLVLMKKYDAKKRSWA